MKTTTVKHVSRLGLTPSGAVRSPASPRRRIPIAILAAILAVLPLDDAATATPKI